ncbi:DNA-binding protein DDB_G0278111-like isoform X1 [Zingiber officinale]|uniref:DNA-binding protein DDB_G0278111-like isoform X1 n=1 Tax=Zingiber officinale TaxID=94328 RepID=UPI001C4DA966|nr:DNA-binding protein DDB_G0278111-like isoform X1 [Zingiber officinale]
MALVINKMVSNRMHKRKQKGSLQDTCKFFLFQSSYTKFYDSSICNSKYRDAEERRQLMLSQILSTQARERLARIALVKPDKARGVEDVLLRAAQMGQVSEKVSEERLISLLEQINSQTSKQTKVTIQRRRSVLEDDD